MSSAVEQIKSRLGIVDVVGSYLKLEKAGGNFKAKCPFHNEKTPSFFVSPSRESYHCFGCDKGGDILSFVQDIEGVDFIGALKILAEKAGVTLDSAEKYEKSEKGRLSSLLNAAIDFYRRELVKNSEALDYLKKRGLKGETVTKFKIGFAPNGWRSLSDNLKRLGYKDSEIEAAGLSIKSPGGYYDRFRSRIMFPIFSVSGAPVGFSGRIFEAKDKKKGSEKNPPAKYINSPQTAIYDKSRALFGIDKAKVPMRQKNECVLVEGQFDLIMSHQAGVENAVAVSGTALTEEHLFIINRLAEKLIMAFDGDSAGLKASARAINLALSLGMEVRLAVLPNDIDPADVIQKDPEEWKRIVTESKHIVDFFLDSFLNRKLSKDALSKEIEKQVLPYIASIKSKIEQAKFVNKVAEILKITEEAVWDELKKVEGIWKDGGEKQGVTKKGPVLLKENSRQGDLKKLIWSIIEWQRGSAIDESSRLLNIPEAENTFIDLVGAPEHARLNEYLSPNKNQLILEVEISFSEASNLAREVSHLLDSLKEEIIRGKREAEWLGIKEAEKNGNVEDALVHLKEFQKLSKEFDDIKKLKS